MHRSHQCGFVLVATLWILAIVTISATYFATRVNRSLALAQHAQQVAEEELAMANSRAEIMFRLGTTLLSINGLGESPQSAIRLDDRLYRGSGGDVIQLQDNRGLLNVNFVEQTMLARLLGQLGIPAEKRDAMIDKLRDYTDMDNLRRLNGAEAPEYEAAHLPPPPNEWLMTPNQLKNVLDWNNQLGLWTKNRLPNLVTTARVAGFNPNTAPAEVLASLPGGSWEAAQSIIAARHKAPLISTAQLAGVLLDPEYILFFPGDSFRITQSSKNVPWAVQFSITLTPMNLDTPWRIDYYGKTIVPYALEKSNEIPGLPARTASPSSPTEAF